MMDLIVMEVILVHFVENPKFWSGFGPAGHFLEVYLVESIDKRLIFGLGSMCNR